MQYHVSVVVSFFAENGSYFSGSEFIKEYPSALVIYFIFKPINLIAQSNNKFY